MIKKQTLALAALGIALLIFFSALNEYLKIRYAPSMLLIISGIVIVVLLLTKYVNLRTLLKNI